MALDLAIMSDAEEADDFDNPDHVQFLLRRMLTWAMKSATR